MGMYTKSFLELAFGYDVDNYGYDISDAKFIGKTVLSTYYMSTDEAAKKNWKIYDTRKHNKLVIDDYAHNPEPILEEDYLIVKGIYETPNTVRVYAGI